jgi:hypothetical protein
MMVIFARPLGPIPFDLYRHTGCGDIESFLRTGMELPRGFGQKVMAGTR